MRWELAIVDAASGAVDDPGLARIAARCHRFIEDWEARKAHSSDAVGFVRDTLDPLGTIGVDAKSQQDLLRLGKCLAVTRTRLFRKNRS